MRTFHKPESSWDAENVTLPHAVVPWLSSPPCWRLRVVGPCVAVKVHMPSSSEIPFTKPPTVRDPFELTSAIDTTAATGTSSGVGWGSCCAGVGEGVGVALGVVVGLPVGDAVTVAVTTGRAASVGASSAPKMLQPASETAQAATSARRAKT